MTEAASKALVYLDANVFIFFLEGAPSISEPIKPLFDILRDHPGAAVTSELTLAEVLAGPEKTPNPLLKRAYLDLIVWNNFIDLRPVSREVLYDSAQLRAVHENAYQKKLKLPDAIHLVTGIQSRCTHLLSANQGIYPPKGMKKAFPDATGIGDLCKALA